MQVSNRVFRNLQVSQDRGFYSGVWYPHIIRYKGKDYVVVDLDAYMGPEIRLARAEDWAKSCLTTYTPH